MSPSTTTTPDSQPNVLRLSGALDIFDAESLRDQALDVIGGGDSKLLQVDLQEVETLDATAIQILIALRKTASAKGIEVQFTTPAEVLADLALLGIAI